MFSSSRRELSPILRLLLILASLNACDDETAADTGSDVVDQDTGSDPGDAAEGDPSDSTSADLDDPPDLETDEGSTCEPTATVMCSCEDYETYYYCCDGGGQVYLCETDSFWHHVSDAYCGMPEFPEFILCPWRQQ